MAPSSANEANDLPPDMQRILGKRKIVVAMHAKDGPPFYMHDKEGRFYGLDVEIAYDIGRSLGVDVEFDRSAETFDGVLSLVADRKADLAISCISRTRKRAVRVSFSKAYMKLHHALIINRVKAAKLKAGKDASAWLNTSTVALGTLKGSAYVEYAQRDYANVQLVQYSNFDDAARDVLKGLIHAALYDDSVIMDWINEHPADALYVQGMVLRDKEDPLGIAVHWQDGHLLKWIDLYLDTIEADGTLRKLKQMYLESTEWKNPRARASE